MISASWAAIVSSRSRLAAARADEVGEQRADLLEVGHVVDGGGGQRARHRGMRGRARVLDDDRAARLLHRHRAVRAVASRSR